MAQELYLICYLVLNIFLKNIRQELKVEVRKKSFQSQEQKIHKKKNQRKQISQTPDKNERP